MKSIIVILLGEINNSDIPDQPRIDSRGVPVSAPATGGLDIAVSLTVE